MWDNQDDARMRLGGCTVLLGIQPVLITRVTVDLRLQYIRLADGKEGFAKINSQRWNWKPIRCGYVNYGDTCYYLERLPVRRWKHGLHPENVRTVPNTAGADLLKTEAFARVLVKGYPSFKDALGTIRAAGLRGQAFHRNYAIQTALGDTLYVLHRGAPVGVIEDDKVVLQDDYHFLKEEIEELTA